MKIQELEYKGMNLVDEVGTVEIAIDSVLKTIHIYDTQQIVAPEYEFLTKSYQLSEGFFNMATVLKQKQFFLETDENNLLKWVNAHTWIFYCANQSVKIYTDEQMIAMANVHARPWPEEDFRSETLYLKYLERLKR